ncbi:hypothetical protein VNO77_42142 [Canavalia gladiata]|uniref:BZIP domain-containing protein n=1 Tax=Canavalia gladiata TaxID=3824 RepID=A0AAN9JZQ2_CANGL
MKLGQPLSGNANVGGFCQQETLDKPLPSRWITSMQANSTLHQSDALHDPRRLSSKPTVAGDAALAFSEIVHRTFGERNLNSMERCARNLQPIRSITKKLRENGKKSSIWKDVPETYDKDGVLWSGTNESKGSHEDHDANNDFPSTTEQQCNLMPENANAIELNQNLGMGLNASGADAQLAKLEKDKIRKERKRQSNRESAKRSRIRREKECEELYENMGILKDKNSLLTQRLVRLSEDCVELRNENDSIQEELVQIYGPESIADLLPMKPA